VVAAAPIGGVVAMFCSNCGNEISDRAAICVKCGVPTSNMTAAIQGGSKSRLVYILLGVFLGGLGIHNFYAGRTGRGVAQLLITLFTFWLIVPLIAVWIWVIVEICTVKVDGKGQPMLTN
jgi:TM2 domain-containing membrane protein YozV